MTENKCETCSYFPELECMENEDMCATCTEFSNWEKKEPYKPILLGNKIIETTIHDVIMGYKKYENIMKQSRDHKKVEIMKGNTIYRGYIRQISMFHSNTLGKGVVDITFIDVEVIEKKEEDQVEMLKLCEDCEYVFDSSAKEPCKSCHHNFKPKKEEKPYKVLPLVYDESNSEWNGITEPSPSNKNDDYIKNIKLNPFIERCKTCGYHNFVVDNNVYISYCNKFKKRIVNTKTFSRWAYGLGESCKHHKEIHKPFNSILEGVNLPKVEVKELKKEKEFFKDIDHLAINGIEYINKHKKQKEENKMEDKKIKEVQEEIKKVQKNIEEKERVIEEILDKRRNLIKIIRDNWRIFFYEIYYEDYRFNKDLNSFLELNRKERKVLKKFKIRYKTLKYKGSEEFYKNETWNEVKGILEKIVKNLDLYKLKKLREKCKRISCYAEKDTCSACKSELQKEAKFCHSCGRRVE